MADRIPTRILTEVLSLISKTIPVHPMIIAAEIPQMMVSEIMIPLPFSRILKVLKALWVDQFVSQKQILMIEMMLQLVTIVALSPAPQSPLAMDLSPFPTLSSLSTVLPTTVTATTTPCLFHTTSMATRLPLWLATTTPRSVTQSRAQATELREA